MASLRRYNRIRPRMTSRFRSRRGAALLALCALLGGAIFLTVNGAPRDPSARLAHSPAAERGLPHAIDIANGQSLAREPAHPGAGFDREALERLAASGVDPAPVGSIPAHSPGFRIVRPDPSSPGFREIAPWRGRDQ